MVSAVDGTGSELPSVWPGVCGGTLDVILTILGIEQVPLLQTSLLILGLAGPSVQRA